MGVQEKCTTTTAAAHVLTLVLTVAGNVSIIRVFYNPRVR